MPRKATSADVARLAGVSRSAVSFVLNGRADGNIAKDKQELIRAAARELHYTPNAVARSLQSSRTHTIGVVTDAIAGSPFAGKLLQGAGDAALAAGYLLLVIDTHSDAHREAGAFAALHDRQVDALMYAAMSLREYTPPAAMAGGPAVLANSYDPAGSLRAVIPDEVAGGRAAAQVLIDAGHRRVAFLSGTDELVAPGLRATGFRQALAAAGLPEAPIIPTGWQINDGFAGAMALLTDALVADDGGPRPGADRPTGIVCANDRVAMGVLLACGRLGLRVPQDVSIVGYDDDETIAAPSVPALTTIALPHREMGEQAISLLLGALAEDAPAHPAAGNGPLLLECPVISRDSVAAPAA
ncbi:LacI family DNA-binding transcriptional regulator [Specibacter cremeus]|uniref:LacI family DNA-binding transcriptional regulator n=1 Tax=Specibacter cremeus TaxID=1629051 RepID=UPI000F791CEB|nr:LacI family DNA-binding transcriptional regulator [Specibacter cremeus]